ISLENIEQFHSFSRPDRDPRGCVVTVSYLAFIGEVPLIAGDDAKEVHWFYLVRLGHHISLSLVDVVFTLVLISAAS
ncbi:NUDIX hydrolase, partial [Enterococcus faecalis]